MQINRELVEKVVAEVIAEVLGSQSGSAPTPTPREEVSGVAFAESGRAVKGTDPKEVVLALTPAFGTTFSKTIVDVPHAEVLRQIFAGVEEEGLKIRVVLPLAPIPTPTR